MPRPLRVEYAGAIYHVMNRGNRRERIFRNPEDYRLMLETLDEACQKTGWQVHAWCLMSNHFHLVIETPRPNLVFGMKWLLGVYTKRFNIRHKTCGHLFAGRYKALPVDGSGTGYLRTVCDYVHLNPARAKLVKPELPLESYAWSSYGYYIAEPVRCPPWLRVDRLMGEFGIPRDSKAGRQEFAARMEARRKEEERIRREEAARLAEVRRKEEEAHREAERVDRERREAEARRREEARREIERAEEAKREARRKEQEAREAKDREAVEAAKAEKAKADQEIADAKAKRDREAAEAKEKSDREAQEAAAAIERVKAERKDQERVAAEARDRVAVSTQRANTTSRAAQAKPSDLSRTRTDLGAIASLRTEWKAEVTDAELVPRLYLSVDEGAIAYAVKAATTADGKCPLKIPGVKIYPVTNSVVR